MAAIDDRDLIPVRAFDRDVLAREVDVLDIDSWSNQDRVAILCYVDGVLNGGLVGRDINDGCVNEGTARQNGKQPYQTLHGRSPQQVLGKECQGILYVQTVQEPRQIELERVNRQGASPSWV